LIKVPEASPEILSTMLKGLLPCSFLQPNNLDKYSAMKNLIFISLLFFSKLSFASTREAIISGNWSSSSTWNGSAPLAGDEVLIPPGITVNIDISTPMILRLTNNGTLVIINNSISVLYVSQNVYNNSNFINDGKAYVHGSLFNSDTIIGDGAFCVWDTTSNTQYIGGTVDFCDITPPAAPPYVDINTGTVLGTVTFCQAGLCAPAGIFDVEQTDRVSIAPNISSGIFKIKCNDYRQLTSVVVTDGVGRIIYKMYNNFTEIDLTQFNSGIYFYVLEEKSQNIYRGKLMKK